MTEQGEFTPLTGDGEPQGCCAKFMHSIRACLAEFVAVALFVFVGCMAVQTQFPGAIAVAHGFAIAILVCCFGHISGAHINPAVTLGVALSGAISPLKAVLYVISQLLGGVVGSLFVRLILDRQTSPDDASLTVYEVINAGAHLPGKNVDVFSAIVVEIIITSVLVLTVLLTAVDEEGKAPLAPIAIGFAVVVGILAGFYTSGGSMNPARSFGPAVVRGTTEVWIPHYVYWIGPGLGAVLAAAMYKFSFATASSRVCGGK